MATAKKQPSGQWKCRVYSHTDSAGKKHYRAFTASTKQEAEQMAAKFSGALDRAAHEDPTVKEALTGYVHSRAGVLSPSTVRGYNALMQYYVDIEHRRLSRLKSIEVQTWISNLAGRLSPKTVSNIYGLFTASVALYDPDKSFSVKLPSKQKKRPVAASDDQIAALYMSASHNLKKAIALSAFASLRRGEICALKYRDIKDGYAHIHSDMVRGADGWYLKPTPKTSDSDRFVRLPQSVLDLIGEGKQDDFVVPITPDTITECFGRLRDNLGIPIRFHDLRHYFASIAAVLNVPDTYTESFGGWRAGSNVMKQVYQNRIDNEANHYAAKMTDHFDTILKKYDPKYDLKK